MSLAGSFFLHQSCSTLLRTGLFVHQASFLPPRQPIATSNAFISTKPHYIVEPLPAVVVTASEVGFRWTYSRNCTDGGIYLLGYPSAALIVDRRQPVPSIRETLSSWFEFYMKSLKQRPLLTKAISAAAVQVLGDMISQPLSAYCSGRALVYDYPRTFCFALVGFFFKAPYLHNWYRITARFGRKVQRAFKLTDNQRTLAELALDQSIGVVTFLPAYFYVYEFFSALVQCRGKFMFNAMLGIGHYMKYTILTWRLSGSLVPYFLPFTMKGLGPIFAAIIANYSFWPFSQFLSFRYVPESLRVLHTNLAAIFWNIYFCSCVAHG